MHTKEIKQVMSKTGCTLIVAKEAVSSTSNLLAAILWVRRLRLEYTDELIERHIKRGSK